MYIANVALAIGIRLVTELDFKKDLTKIFIFGVRRPEKVQPSRLQWDLFGSIHRNSHRGDERWRHLPK